MPSPKGNLWSNFFLLFLTLACKRRNRHLDYWAGSRWSHRFTSNPNLGLNHSYLSFELANQVEVSLCNSPFLISAGGGFFPMKPDSMRLLELGRTLPLQFSSEFLLSLNYTSLIRGLFIEIRGELPVLFSCLGLDLCTYLQQQFDNLSHRRAANGK